MLKLAENLARSGCDVHVIAARGRDFGDFGYGPLLRTLNVHYVADPLHRRGSGMSGSTTSIRANAGRESAKQRILARALATLKPFILEAAVPDTGIAAVYGFYRRASALIRARGIRNVVTSGPPHSTHLVGWLLKRKFGVRLNWAVDYRDSWNGTSLFRKSTAIAQAVNMRAERAVLDRTDHLIYVSPPMLDKAKAIARTPQRLESRASLVMNGFDDAMLAYRRPWANRPGPVRIGYFGALDDAESSYRNPTTLFSVIADERLPVHIDLWGAVNIAKRWSDTLGDQIAVCGNLPHDQAFARMCEYDALLLIHTRREGAEEVITGKLFEYLASGRPVISIGPRVMAANQIIARESCNFACEHDDPRAISQLLREIVRHKETGTLPHRSVETVSQYSRSHQYSLLNRVLV